MLAALLFKLNLHHALHVEHDDDGALYKGLRCGKDVYRGDGASDG
jgi:hypothetical protein